VTRDGLEAVVRQLARREVVAQHGVERVDQLAAGHGEAHAAVRVALARGAPARGAGAEAGRAGAAERERDAEGARAALEERQVEPVQVVVLDHVRIERLHARGERPDERGLGGVAVAPRLEVLDPAVRTAERGEEDAAEGGVEAGGLEIDLDAAQIVEHEAAEVGPARRGEVLLLGRQHEHVGLELAEMADRAAEPTRRAAEHGAGELAEVGRGDHEAQRAGAIELAVRDAAGAIAGAVAAGAVAAVQLGAEVREVLERGEHEPRPEAHLLAHERAAAGRAAPHERATVGLRPHRDDAGRRVPAPQPLVLARGQRRGSSGRAPVVVARSASSNAAPSV
jgi:hypothetical protein